MALEKVVGIRLKGANFEASTDITLFNENSEYGLGLLYGKNGAGKSTISRGFSLLSGKEEMSIESASLIDKDKNVISVTDEEKKSIFVFNEDFVDENIRLDENATGLETIVVLGEKVDIQKKLDEAEKQFKSADEAYQKKKQDNEKYYSTISDKAPVYWVNAIKQKLKEKDGWAQRDSYIKGNKKASTVGDDKYKEFVGRKPKESESSLRNQWVKRKIDLEEAKSGKKFLSKPVLFDIDFSYNEEDYKGLLGKKIERPVLSEREKYLLQLQKQMGLAHINSIKSTFKPEAVVKCPLCLQDVSEEYKTSLFTSIEKILNKAVEEHIEQLDKLFLQEISFDFEYYAELAVEVEGAKSALAVLNAKILEWNSFLEKKKNNVYEDITDIDIGLQAAIDAYKGSLQNLESARVEYNKDITDTKPIIEDLTEINSDITYYEIKQLYEKYLSCETIQKKEQLALSKLENERKAKLLSVENLRQTKKDIKIALKDINEGLKYIFYSENRLSIDLNGVNAQS